MKKNRFLLSMLLLLMFLMFSCTPKQENKVYSDLFLTLRDVNFQRAKGIKEFRVTKFFETDSVKMFVNLIEDRNKLLFYNYDSGEFMFEMNIPHRIRIGDFFINNLNSIYFIPNYTADIMEYKNQETIDTLFTVFSFGPDNIPERLLDVVDDYDMGYVMEFMPEDFYVEDSVFYIKNATDFKGDMNEQRSFYIISTKKNQFDLKSKVIGFPPEMKPKDSTYYPFCREIMFARNNKKQTVASFMPDHSLYIYSDSALIKKIECKSSLVNNLPKPVAIKDNSDWSKIFKERLYGNEYYKNIYYDKYRDVYYRIAVAKSDKDENGNYISFSSKYSIMLIDKNFNIIGEQIFSVKDYSYVSLEVTTEGIMLRKWDDLSGTTRYTVFKINPKYLK